MKGSTSAVGLWNPKFAHNVGAALRACSYYGIPELWFSGDRVSLDPTRAYRLPREERMTEMLNESRGFYESV